MSPRAVFAIVAGIGLLAVGLKFPSGLLTLLIVVTFAVGLVLAFAGLWSLMMLMATNRWKFWEAKW